MSQTHYQSAPTSAMNHESIACRRWARNQSSSSIPARPKAEPRVCCECAYLKLTKKRNQKPDILSHHMSLTQLLKHWTPPNAKLQTLNLFATWAADAAHSTPAASQHQQQKQKQKQQQQQTNSSNISMYWILWPLNCYVLPANKTRQLSKRLIRESNIELSLIMII